MPVTARFAGTYTFLLTDIESSTARWAEDRVTMAEALRAHDAALTAAVAACEGELFKHTGDGICAVFGSAAQALGAAIAAQRVLGLPVRMGLHTGEAQSRNGDYFGPTLNRCARVMDAGHGGQILMTSATRALLDGEDVTDLGEHMLKGLDLPERIFQVGSTAFPALRTSALPSSMPSQRSILVGREELIGEVADRFAQSRLVTLVGVGGVGKTRLAVAAAEAVSSRFDRVAFVDLASVTDGAEVLPSVARALQLTTVGTDAIAVAASGIALLLVMDNCEHVLDEAADLIECLLDEVATVSVLATSREGLAVDGERLVAVPGLDSHDLRSPGVDLFLDRARQANPELVLGPDDERTVVELCQRLDGIPLAIELAGARTAVLSVQELADRLDQRFQILTGGRRRRSRDRHRTLRETVDWSFELLDDDERELFIRLGVFAGNFDLAGAIAVSGDLDDLEVLDLIEALVQKSLLTVSTEAGRPRYRYLETIRSYAEEKLDAGGGHDDVAARMHAHLVDRLRRAPLQAEPPTWITDELPNMRRALDESLGRSDLDAAVAMVTPFLTYSSAVPWISGWGEEALALPEAPGSKHEAALLNARLNDVWIAGRFIELRSVADQMLVALERGAPDDLWPDLLLAAGFAHQLSGDDLTAARHSARATEMADRLPHPAPLRARLAGHIISLASRYPRLPDIPGRHEDITAALAEPSWILRYLAHELVTLVANDAGDFDTMLRSARTVEDLSVEPSIGWFWSLQMQALAELRLGHLREALRLADRDLDRAHRCGDLSAMVIPTAIFALVLQVLDEPEAAAIARGALPPRLTALYVDDLAALDIWLHDQMEPTELAVLTTQGRAMAPAQLQVLTHDIADRQLGDQAQVT
jgi:predicted ATPase